MGDAAQAKPGKRGPYKPRATAPISKLRHYRMSARGMAAELNRRGVPTPMGGRWHAQTVLRTKARVIADLPSQAAARRVR